MEIAAMFTVSNLKGIGPERVAAAFEQFLRDMLYIGCEPETDDPFAVEDVKVKVRPQ